jgi:hypothetical protein
MGRQQTARVRQPATLRTRGVSRPNTRTITHPAENLSKEPGTSDDHTQPQTEPAFNRFALKAVALRTRRSTGSAERQRHQQSTPRSSI